MPFGSDQHHIQTGVSAAVDTGLRPLEAVQTRLTDFTMPSPTPFGGIDALSPDAVMDEPEGLESGADQLPKRLMRGAFQEKFQLS